ncbi:drug/metabolite transporter (DMT)-like permease [Paucibacter oligotrophus]|uniref:Drug/metabolite transporter (DMT)-like permease n=1 Tax=Roseateles oligotrophus TaxID=1769250 RepID=A0A840LDG3_9BURK|nr:DMT family transporter [Roseateles oligotrophus]MBB4843367.1 drug/metabolite transporter (DMT)-like permease [Roseateles oligotrophus]
MKSAISDRWLFWGPTLVWASTWHVILYQLAAPVPVLNSVAWRFALAAVLLAGLALWRGESLRLPWRAHGLMLATGIVQYGGNYWSVYEAERHIPSGLVAVLFCLMVFGNALSGRLFFGQQVTRRFLLAASGGVAGVVMIFWPEIASTGARPSAALGLGLGLLAVLAACTGNVLTLTLTRRGLPLLPILAWSMGYGALFLIVLALGSGVGLRFDWRPSYLLSLLYLSVFGSVIAFVLYFKLAQRQGPARAALTGVIIPVIALMISAALEGWQLSLQALLGMGLCLGSIFVATRRPAAV